MPETFHDDILRESKAACWACRLAFVPLAGMVCYFVLGLVAMLVIGRGGRFGLFLLVDGFKRLVTINFIAAVLYCGFYITGWLPALYPYFPKHGLYHENIVISDNEYGFLEGMAIPETIEVFKDIEVDADVTYKYGVKEGPANGAVRRLNLFDETLEEPDVEIDSWEEFDSPARITGSFARSKAIAVKSKEKDRTIVSQFRGLYSEDKKNGVWKLYSEAQQLLYTDYYYDNELKTRICFSPNGIAESETNYRQKLLHGWSYTWDKDGHLLEKGQYQNNARVGVWTQYHPNGVKAAEGKYRRTHATAYITWLHDGAWKYWDSDGNLTCEEFHSGYDAMVSFSKKNIFVEQDVLVSGWHPMGTERIDLVKDGKIVIEKSKVDWGNLANQYNFSIDTLDEYLPASWVEEAQRAYYNNSYKDSLNMEDD